MFESRHVPAVLCNALITPVYKKGDKLDTTNYRPIAVMDPLLKLYSSILNSWLVAFTERKQLQGFLSSWFSAPSFHSASPPSPSTLYRQGTACVSSIILLLP